MPKLWINNESLKSDLTKYFIENKREITEFGNTVNQTFEAFVFASLVNWYIKNAWKVEFVNPDPESKFVKLKFSTRGKPSGYTYALCSKGTNKIQIRHGLRVATKYHRDDQAKPANVVLDVAVISDTDLSKHKTNDHAYNVHLITFGEAKHMSAFAELIANFIGLVHEMAPDRVKELRPYIGPILNPEHPAPFLYVSGHLWPSAQGIVETIRYRGYDIDIYDYETGSIFGVKLPVMPAKLGSDISESDTQ